MARFLGEASQTRAIVRKGPDATVMAGPEIPGFRSRSDVWFWPGGTSSVPRIDALLGHRSSD
jgi:hypothetical protein